MPELDREQIIAELQEIIDHFAGSLNRYWTLSNALTLIKDQAEQIFKLENRLKECENGYEGTLFLDRCKLHDAEEKVKQLTEEKGNIFEEIEYILNHIGYLDHIDFEKLKKK